jgi:hypothetical protein
MADVVYGVEFFSFWILKLGNIIQFFHEIEPITNNKN